MRRRAQVCTHGRVATAACQWQSGKTLISSAATQESHAEREDALAAARQQAAQEAAAAREAEAATRAAQADALAAAEVHPAAWGVRKL